MSRSPLPWFLKCLGFCLLGTLLLGFVGHRISALIAWAIYHDDPTASRLRITPFTLRYYLPFCPIYGFLLGLIPWNRIREAFQSYLGNFNARTYDKTANELDFTRPILWAWAPVTIVFLLRFALWRPLSHSVLSTASSSPARLNYFFQPPNFAMLASLPDVGLWMVDRYAITGPTLFLLAYPIGVWLRHQFPSLPNPDPSAIESSPLIHSIEAENIHPTKKS